MSVQGPAPEAPDPSPDREQKPQRTRHPTASRIPSTTAPAAAVPITS
jgi:hypothetical protein